MELLEIASFLDVASDFEDADMLQYFLEHGADLVAAHVDDDAPCCCDEIELLWWHEGGELRAGVEFPVDTVIYDSYADAYSALLG